jgi:plastocyanin
MRRWLLLAVCALACGCNSVTGIDKYVVDLVDSGKSASSTDGGSAADGSTTTDGAATCNYINGGPVVPDCSDGDLAKENHTAPGDPRVIQAPSGDSESPFVPDCMTIKAGQSVTFRGKLTSHPVIPRERSTLPNPIFPSDPTTNPTEVTYAFPCPGDYNFACKNHKDQMLGTIRVVP